MRTVPAAPCWTPLPAWAAASWPLPVIVARRSGATLGVPVSQSASVATTDWPLALSLPVAARSKERVTELRAIRDQARADAERAWGALDRLGPSITPQTLKTFAMEARKRMRIDSGGYRWL